MWLAGGVTVRLKSLFDNNHNTLLDIVWVSWPVPSLLPASSYLVWVSRCHLLQVTSYASPWDPCPGTPLSRALPPQVLGVTIIVSCGLSQLLQQVGELATAVGQDQLPDVTHGGQGAGSEGKAQSSGCPGSCTQSHVLDSVPPYLPSTAVFSAVSFQVRVFSMRAECTQKAGRARCW